MQYELYEGLHRSKRTKACTNESLSERYKGRQIPEFKVSLGQSKLKPRCADLRDGSHPASLLSVLTKADRSLNSFAMLRQMRLLFPRGQGAKVKKC